MKWENEWLMFALLGISTFLFQKKEGEKGKKSEKIVLVAIHQSPGDVRLMEKLCRPYDDGLFVSVSKNA